MGTVGEKHSQHIILYKQALIKVLLNVGKKYYTALKTQQPTPERFTYQKLFKYQTHKNVGEKTGENSVTRSLKSPECPNGTT